MKHIYALLYLVGQVLVTSAQCPETLVIQLDSTAIRNLQSTPIQAIPQPVAGHYIQVMGMEVNVTPPYTNSPLLIAYHLGSSEGAFFSVGLYSGEPFYTGWPPVNGGEIVADAPVMLTVSDSAIGNGSATIIVTYRVVSLTGVTLCDTLQGVKNNNDGKLCKKTVHLTSSQILNLNSTPQVIIPAPPTGKYINPITAQIRTYAGTPYSGNFIMNLFEGDTVQYLCSNATSLLYSTDTLKTFGLWRSDGTLRAATPLSVMAQNGNPAGGNTSIDITIFYVILDEDSNECFGGSTNIPHANDSVTDLTLDSVDLLLNTATIITAQGAIVNLLLKFPTGTNGDILQVTLTQDVVNVLFQGTNIDAVSPRRRAELINTTEITFRNYNGQWY